MGKICISDTTFYNRGSSTMLGWDPTWFGLLENDWGPALEREIKSFQKEYDIKVDGLVGPVTFTRMQTARDAIDEEKKHIHTGLKQSTVDAPRVDVKTFYDKLPKSNYRFVNLNVERNINKIVIHWDAALSTESCFKILKKRGYSTHFSIDNDGTIYQFLNTNHEAYHAKESNSDSIGIDISNAYYLKYNDVYERRGFGRRPVITSKVNGEKLGPHLGYYARQISATKELIKSLCDRYDIPLVMPDKFVKDPASTPGIMFHYHLNDGKIDTAGFPLDIIIKELDEEE